MKNKSINSVGVCRCGSAKDAANCCEMLLSARQKATSPEQLMRARYVAYATGNMDYVVSTWHSSTRPSELAQSESIQWLGLEVLSAPQLSENEKQGFVEFKATFRQKHINEHKTEVMHERSRFVFENGCWFYIDGEQCEVIPAEKKMGRNELCLCASGKKYKKCCGKN